MKTPIKTTLTINQHNRITTIQEEGQPTNIAITLSDIKVYDGDLTTLADILQKHRDENPRFTLRDCYNEELQCYLIYRVSLIPISNLIPPTDWKPKFYKLHTHAVNDFNKSFNIGYKIFVDQLRIKPNPKKENELQYIANNFDDYVRGLINCIDTSYTTHQLTTRQEIGREIKQNSIIVIIDQDNNIVDIRPPFAHELYEYHLINQHDDCHERFLLHSTTDNTEAEIIREIFDNYVFHIIENPNEYQQRMNEHAIYWRTILTRNFFNKLK